MTTECTLRLPAIEWPPRLKPKPAMPTPPKQIVLEHMTLNELLYLALTSAR